MGEATPQPLVEINCSEIRYEVIIWAKRFLVPISVCPAERRWVGGQRVFTCITAILGAP